MRPALLVAAASLVVASCAGSADHGGQPSLVQRTVAGQNACNPQNHDRPFILEWDATDQSSFQARAGSDVIVVHYEGCNLKVLDGCNDDAVKGSLGAYKPVDWTSGQLETMDIHDEGELYAKLPLGAASLDGRVSKGEKLHMEYFVSGTRSATRPAVYAKDLERIPACKGATHFVYAYNLGAFALASASSLKGQVNGSYFGFGAGGTQTSTSQAEKKGGDLAACKGASAKEVEACKVPIRLTLREITSGEDPSATAARAPETATAANLAGQLKAQTDREKEALQHEEAAVMKARARDGKGCLAELDLHDQLDPRPEGISTNPKGHAALERATCIMLAGQCDAGKQLYRKAFEAQHPELAAGHIDNVADAVGAQSCQGGAMSPRDQLLKAKNDIQQGSMGVAKTQAECASAYDTVMRLRTPTPPLPAPAMDPTMVPDGLLLAVAPQCFARAGDCASAARVHREIWMRSGRAAVVLPNFRDQAEKGSFEALVPSCKGR